MVLKKIYNEETKTQKIWYDSSMIYYTEMVESEAENKEKDYSKDNLWVHNGTDTYVMVNGNPLNIEYMNKIAYDEAVCYLAKENIAYVFDKIEGAEAFLSGVNRLSFPPADTKLYRSFPELNIKIDLI